MPLDISSNAIIEKNKLTSTNVELLLLEFIYEDESPVRVCLNNAEIMWNSYTWYPAVFSLTGMNETKEGDIPKVTLNFFDLDRVIIPVIEDTDGLPNTRVNIYIVDSLYLDDTTPKLEESALITSVNVNENCLVTMELGTIDLSLLRIPKKRYLKNHCRFNFKEITAQFQAGGITEAIAGYYIKGQTDNAKGIITDIETYDGVWASNGAKGLVWINIIEGEFAQSANEAVNAYADSDFTEWIASGIFSIRTGTVVAPCGYSGTETNCNRSYARCIELSNETRYGGFPGVGGEGVYK